MKKALIGSFVCLMSVTNTFAEEVSYIPEGFIEDCSRDYLDPYKYNSELEIEAIKSINDTKRNVCLVKTMQEELNSRLVILIGLQKQLAESSN